MAARPTVAWARGKVLSVSDTDGGVTEEAVKAAKAARASRMAEAEVRAWARGKRLNSGPTPGEGSSRGAERWSVEKAAAIEAAAAAAAERKAAATKNAAATAAASAVAAEMVTTAFEEAIRSCCAARKGGSRKQQTHAASAAPPTRVARSRRDGLDEPYPAHRHRPPPRTNPSMRGATTAPAYCVSVAIDSCTWASKKVPLVPPPHRRVAQARRDGLMDGLEALTFSARSKEQLCARGRVWRAGQGPKTPHAEPCLRTLGGLLAGGVTQLPR